MAISDADYLLWLENPNVRRVILVEAEHSAGTKYFGNADYITSSSDMPASMPFDDYLANVPQITSSINSDSNYGSLTLINNGELDDWINLKFKGYSIVVKIGDSSWDYSDFRNIIDGVNGGLSVPNNSAIEFTIFTKRDIFNTPLQTAKITASPTTLQSNDTFKPISFGECFNVRPKLVNSTTHQYIAHDGTCTISSVRDNGVSASFTDAGNGTFTLTSAPTGDITCTVSEANDTVKEIVLDICSRLSFTDYDSTNINAFSNTNPIGYHINDNTTGANVLDAVLTSVGGFWIINRLGDLQIHRLELPGTSTYDLYDHSIEEFGLNIVGIEDPNTVLTLGYNKNWATQDKASLDNTLSEANRELYSAEFSVVKATNSLSGFPRADEKDFIPAFFNSSANAQTEVNRRATIRSARRYRYSIKAFVEPFNINVGDTITVYYNRFGFENGKDVFVLAITEYPTDNTALLEVWA